jgi:hypothetical protein
MHSWVIPSNPTKYDAKAAFMNNGEVDWVTNNNFNVGDIVYLYEVIPPRGRGGIVYKTAVVQTDIHLSNKIEDRKYWSGQAYPKDITEQTSFSRLKLIGEPNGKGLSYYELKLRGFSAPQFRAILLDKKPALMKYIQDFFD